MSAAPFFDEEDIEDLRGEAESAMPHLASIYGPPTSALSDKGEDATGDFTLVVSGVPARLENTVRQAREESIGGRLTATGKWVIAVPYTQVLTVKQRIVLTDLNRTFEVIGLVSDSYLLEVENRAECDEVT